MLLNVARSSYYKWLSGKKSNRMLENERLAEKVEQIHSEHPDKGYRRINDDLKHDYDIHVNDKRILRICREKDIKSTIKYSPTAVPEMLNGLNILPRTYLIATFMRINQMKSG